MLHRIVPRATSAFARAGFRSDFRSGFHAMAAVRSEAPDPYADDPFSARAADPTVAASKSVSAAPPASATPNTTSSPSATTTSTTGNRTTVIRDLGDRPLESSGRNWASSFHGLGAASFPKETVDVLLAPIDPEDVEITPDGLLFLPEIKYRRILNKAFGPGGWGLAPRSETTITPKSVTREYGLVCGGRLVSIARGEQDYFNPDGIPTALEGCKSNAMMRCCKDLGIASELWDPKFIRAFKKKYCEEAFVQHVVSKKKRKLWKRKDASWEYPYKASTF